MCLSGSIQRSGFPPTSASLISRAARASSFAGRFLFMGSSQFSVLSGCYRRSAGADSGSDSFHGDNRHGVHKRAAADLSDQNDAAANLYEARFNRRRVEPFLSREPINVFSSNPLPDLSAGMFKSVGCSLPASNVLDAGRCVPWPSAEPWGLLTEIADGAERAGKGLAAIWPWALVRRHPDLPQPV